MESLHGRGRSGWRVARWLGMLLLAVTIVAGVWRPTLAAARQAEGEAGAELTVVHGLADGGPVDLTIDGGAAFFGAGFASRSDPIRLPAGRHELRFTPTGEASGTSLIQGEIEVEPDVPLIVALLGTTSEPRLFAYRVDRSPLAAEDARVRVIHGAADAGGVDVALSGGDLLFPPLAFAEATDYAEIEPGSYDLELRAEATDEVLLALADTELAAGRVTDIVVVGSVADGSLQALSVTTGAETAASGTERRGRLRAGSCADPGDVIAELAVIEPASGDVIGDDAAPVVASGFGTVDRPFAELVGEAAVVTVEEGDDGVVVACGVAQGRLSGDGGLAFPLSAPDGRETSGFVVLSVGGAAPESTDAAIYLLVAE